MQCEWDVFCDLMLCGVCLVVSMKGIYMDGQSCGHALVWVGCVCVCVCVCVRTHESV